MKLGVKNISVLGCVFVLGIYFFPAIYSRSLTPQRKADEIEFFEMSLEELMSIEIASSSSDLEIVYEEPIISVIVSEEANNFYGSGQPHQLLGDVLVIYTQDSFMYPYNMSNSMSDMVIFQRYNKFVLIDKSLIESDSSNRNNYSEYLRYTVQELANMESIHGLDSVFYENSSYSRVVDPKSISILQ